MLQHDIDTLNWGFWMEGFGKVSFCSMINFHFGFLQFVVKCKYRTIQLNPYHIIYLYNSFQRFRCSGLGIIGGVVLDFTITDATTSFIKSNHVTGGH